MLYLEFKIPPSHMQDEENPASTYCGKSLYGVELTYSWRHIAAFETRPNICLDCNEKYVLRKSLPPDCKMLPPDKPLVCHARRVEVSTQVLRHIGSEDVDYLKGQPFSQLLCGADYSRESYFISDGDFLRKSFKPEASEELCSDCLAIVTQGFIKPETLSLNQRASACIKAIEDARAFAPRHERQFIASFDHTVHVEAPTKEEACAKVRSYLTANRVTPLNNVEGVEFVGDSCSLKEVPYEP